MDFWIRVPIILNFTAQLPPKQQLNNNSFQLSSLSQLTNYNIRNNMYNIYSQGYQLSEENTLDTIPINIHRFSITNLYL